MSCAALDVFQGVCMPRMGFRLVGVPFAADLSCSIEQGLDSYRTGAPVQLLKREHVFAFYLADPGSALRAKFKVLSLRRS